MRCRHVCIAVPKVTVTCKKLSSHAKMSTNMIIIRVADKVRPPLPPAPLPVPGATKGRIQRTCHTKPLMILSRLFYFMYTSQRTAAIRVDLYWDKDCPMLLLFFTIKIPYPPPATERRAKRSLTPCQRITGERRLVLWCGCYFIDLMSSLAFDVGCFGLAAVYLASNLL